MKFFAVDQHFIKTPKNDPDFAHPGQEGWGGPHPSYYQYRVMACNLLFADTFAASKIVTSRYDKLTEKEIPLTAPKNTPFPLTTGGQEGCYIPATPQGFFGALTFLTGGTTPPVEDGIRWDNPDIKIDSISDENSVVGSFNPAEVLPVEKELKPKYECAININDAAHLKNCNTRTLQNGKTGFTIHSLNPELDKTIFITAVHPQYSNIRSDSYSVTIPWPSKPQIHWDDNSANLKVDTYNTEEKQATVSFNPACIFNSQKSPQCDYNSAKYRCWSTDSNTNCILGPDVNNRKTVIVSNLKNSDEKVTIEAYNDDYDLHAQNSIVLKEPTPSTVVLQCPANTQQMSKLVAKGNINTSADQYMLLQVPTPAQCNFSANKTSCIIPDASWPKLLCYNATTQQAYQAAGRLNPDAINKEHPDCIATESGTFSGPNCHLSW